MNKILIILSILIFSCQQEKNCGCGRIIKQGVINDTTFYVTIQENCGDTLKTYHLSKEVWMKYKQFQLKKLGHRGYNYSIDSEYCK
jgi:hypothetical protein